MNEAIHEILSPAEVEAYHRDGFVVPEYRLGADRVAKLQELTRHLVADNPTLCDRHMVGRHIPGSGAEGLKARPGWHEFATHRDIVDMMARVMGPDVILWGSGVFHKRAVTGKATPWHRDSEHTPMKPPAGTSAWISVFERTVENGCLRFLRGSHLARRSGKQDVVDSPELFLYTRLVADEVDESTARDVELEPGQLVLFDLFTAHGAAPNTSGRVRAGYTLRFMPSTGHYDHDAAVLRDFKGYGHDTRPLLLLRGTDKCGKNDFQRGHPEPVACEIENQWMIRGDAKSSLRVSGAIVRPRGRFVGKMEVLVM